MFVHTGASSLAVCTRELWQKVNIETYRGMNKILIQTQIEIRKKRDLHVCESPLKNTTDVKPEE